MRRSVMYRLVLPLVVLVAMGLGLYNISLMAHAKPDQLQFTQLQTQIVPLINRAQIKGPAGKDVQLDLSIGLRMRDEQAFDALLSSMYDPHSSLYHQFLTPQQFAARFGPTAQQQQQVTNYLRGRGFTIKQITPNGLLVDATASVSQVEAAFHVQINDYQDGARTFYANAQAPSIPAELSSLILSIGGMDNSVKMHPLLQRMPQATGGYGPADLSGAYNGAALQQSGAQGDGQSVAIFELDGYKASDINQYFQNFNLGQPRVSNVLVGGFNGSAGAGAIEVELDIEVVGAMAPKAAQIIYEGPNTTQGVNATYSKIVNDNQAKVVSISWGECEAQSGAAELQTLDTIFKQAAAQGISMFAASGDSGAYDCNDNSLAVDSPAGDPYIVGVGGTNLQVSNGAYGGEAAWSDPTDTQRSPKGSGGGGGLSNTFKMPSWQTGPGVQNQYSNGNREVPDVSADADPQTGYAVYCTVSASGCPASGSIVVGGTSAAAPLWAGGTTLVNEYLLKQNKSPIGFASPALYALANSQQPSAPFHDVKSGTNLFYPSTATYDMATGLGSPDFFNIAHDIEAGGGGGNPPPPGTPTPTPPPPTTPTAAPTTIPPTSTPPPTTTPVPPGGSLIKNGNFEQGASGWQELSRGGYELVDSSKPHSGHYSAFLCGYSNCNDVLSQSFSVPNGHTTISYWWMGSSNHNTITCRDSFVVQVLDSKGKVIAQLQPQACNTTVTGQWKQVTFDASGTLSRYAGQRVTLMFGARTSLALFTTAFYVDDVAVVSH